MTVICERPDNLFRSSQRPSIKAKIPLPFQNIRSQSLLVNPAWFFLIPQGFLCTPPACFCFSEAEYVVFFGLKELSEKLSSISRVAIHPKYRTVGSGTTPVKETLSSWHRMRRDARSHGQAQPLRRKKPA
jgi:hypothetical protein